MFAWILFASILFAVLNHLIVRSKLFTQKCSLKNCSLRIKNVLDGSSKVNHLNIYKTIHLRVNSLVTTEILTKKISPIFYLCKLDNTSSNVLWFIAMTSLSQWILKLYWKVVRDEKSSDENVNVNIRSSQRSHAKCHGRHPIFDPNLRSFWGQIEGSSKSF